jgi:hypothetical protein
MPQSIRLLVLVGMLAFAACPSFSQAAKDKDKDEPPKVATAGKPPEVGEITLDYAFKNFISGDGRSSMKDFRGSVVLIDWWGTH